MWCGRFLHTKLRASRTAALLRGICMSSSTLQPDHAHIRPLNALETMQISGTDLIAAGASIAEWSRHQHPLPQPANTRRLASSRLPATFTVQV